MEDLQKLLVEGHLDHKRTADYLTSLTYQDNERELTTLRGFMCELLEPPHLSPITEEQVRSYYADQHPRYDFNLPFDEGMRMAEMLNILTEGLIGRPWRRETLTELALGLSVCPYHFLDYAICFDDVDSFPECAMIRLIHPNHDT